MTHAESQDLILDLAFGELDPARAAEVEGHLAGCAECQRERAALDETRRMAAPLRELEEPSAGFDDRILASARAQAQLTHDGNIGEVVEVQGSVRPLGLEAAQIDAHSAPVLAPRRRPRWAMRAALGGSVAAAAVLALVVSTSLQSKHEQVQAARRAAGEKPFEIRVQPAPVQLAANEAVREAKKEEEQKQVAAARDDEQDQVAPRAPAQLAKKAQRAEAEPAPKGMLQGVTSGAAASRGVSGSGGDALGALADKDTRGPAHAKQPSDAPPSPRPAQSGQAAAGAAAAPPPASVRAATAQPPAPVMTAPKSEPAREPKVAAELPGPQASTLAVASRAAAPSPDAPGLERAAQEARHGGDYLRAASLYRQAAAARREAGEQGGEPAWDLTHAIECLAAVGQFDQARQVRAEMVELYPSEKSAFIAAGRALREVDSPAAAVAAPPAKAAPRPESKSKAADEKQGTVPADF